ncbi:MAG: tRNA lysidine(34) synthetase TilS [Phycisphaerae bacterium]|nr:tRNA lysidine(34) synthetase TilS [Phycisphaerae bacterium]
MTEQAKHREADGLVRSVATFIDEQSLIAPGAGVVVGVSGGADSVALLAILRELAVRADRGYALTAAHLHHGLRESADADEAFVRDLAGEWRRIRLISERRDVPAAAQAAGEGIEAAARRLRYEFLAEAAVKAGAACVAVGHHADDNAETVLHRIIRGTHLHGLAGIRPARRLGGSPVMLVRPLLRVRRAEIERYCRRAGIAWRMDPTNTEARFRRNFIRHELLGLLRDRLNPRADEAILRLAEAAADADAYLTAQADEVLSRAREPADGPAGGPQGPPGALLLDCGLLGDQPPVIQTCAMRIALETIGVPMRTVDAEKLGELAELLGGDRQAVPLPGGYLARRRAGNLVLEPPRQNGPALQAEPVELTCPGQITLADGRTVSCRIEPPDKQAFEAHCRARTAGVELLDADKVRGRLICRHRCDGDSFFPLGSPGRQPVSKFLTNVKAPQEDRDRALCICDEVGIVCLAPYRIDDRVKVTAATRRILRLHVDVRPAGE